MISTKRNVSATTFSTYGEHIDDGQRGTLVMWEKPTAAERALLVLPYTYCPNVAELLDTSNWETIKAALAKADPTGVDHSIASFGHWVTGYELMLVRAGSAAHTVAEELMARYANYPVLNEDDFSERETAAFEEDLGDAIGRLTIEIDGAELADSGDAYDTLFCAIARELTEGENRDSCDKSDVEESLTELGFEYEESEMTWRGPLPAV